MPEGPAAKKRRLDHNATKGQANHLSRQLVEWSALWARKARTVLSRPGHGIPTVTEIKLAGRRAQDKEKVEAQVQLKAERASNLTRVEITPAMVRADAHQRTSNVQFRTSMYGNRSLMSH